MRQNGEVVFLVAPRQPQEFSGAGGAPILPAKTNFYGQYSGSGNCLYFQIGLCSVCKSLGIGDL